MNTMPAASPWIVLPILIPLAAGSLSFLFGPRARVPLLAAALAGLWLALVRLVLELMAAGVLHHPVGGWGAPLGIGLRADGLSAVMLLMTATVGSFISLYAVGYFSAKRSGDCFWPLWWFLWAALNGLFLSADLFNLYVTLELLSLSAVGLVALAGDRAALAAGLRYLLAALSGSLAYLMGVALLYGAHGTLALELMAGPAPAGRAVPAAAGLMTVGLLLKTALFPLHFWLPPAHGSALPPVSALLSGLVIKASFYILLRLWFEAFPSALTPAFAQMLGALGGIAVFWGGWLALRQDKLKMLIAWSTVAQIGYLFLVFPLASAASPADAITAWSGGVYQALSHAVAKAALFLSAGAMLQVTDEERVERMEGVGRHLPVSLFAFAVAGVSLMGLPPSGGFVAKWLLLDAALTSGQWWWAAVLILGSLLTAAYVFRVLRRCFLAPPEQAVFHPVPLVMPLAALCLAGIALILGLAAVYPLRLLNAGAPFAAAAGGQPMEIP
jgi:multicomponent Na+:H+ antiporter subunit D